VISYTPQGKPTLKRLVFRTEDASYRDVRDAISSHRKEDGGNGYVTLVLERVVGDDEPLPFDDEPAAPTLEPLKDVIWRDLQKKDRSGEQSGQRGVAERTRSFFGVDEEEEEEQSYW